MSKSLFAAPCQITGVMRRAEAAYRAVLAAKTVADVLHEVVRDVPPNVLQSVGEWVEEKIVR